jgi:membrane fusion protein (multidrug efflux system)
MLVGRLGRSNPHVHRRSFPIVVKRHFFLIAAGVLFALMVLAVVIKLAFAGDGAEKKGGPGGARGGRGQAVAVATISPRDFSDQIRVIGVARGARSVNITSSTSELITRVMFTDGQRVAAGAPLVQLQSREEDAAIIQAQAEVNQARREYDRYRILAERGVAPRVTAETAETALETAQAGLEAARARLGDRVIRAPFSGVLGLTTVTPGTLVSPGGVIATLDDTSVIRVDFPVPERYLGVLRPGLPLTATSDAYQGEAFSGRIALVDSRINESTRAVTARAEFPNPGGRILPGMMLRVAVAQGQRSSLSAPEAAVQYEGQTAFVYRIARGERGETAQRVEVKTGVVEGGFVEILSGVSANDRIVASGLNRIQPNSPVSTGGGQRNGQGNGQRSGGAAKGAAQ